MFGVSGTDTVRYELKRPDGSTAGSISVTKSSKNKSKGKPKRLGYNFKEISSQILRTKTSGSAKQVMARARRVSGMLKQKLKSGEYNDREVEIALKHAMQMERIAKKRMKHLQEEEHAGQQMEGPCDMEDRLPDETALFDTNAPVSEDAASEEAALCGEDLQELLAQVGDQLRGMLEEMSEFSEEMDLADLSDELAGAGWEDMDASDLDLLRLKHRTDEQKDIAEADAKYLKALFEMFAKEKENAGSGVSLELGGMDIPVSLSAPPMEAAPVTGGEVDAAV